MTSLQSNQIPSDRDMDDLCIAMEFLSIEEYEVGGPCETCLYCTGESSDGDYMCTECRIELMHKGYYAFKEVDGEMSDENEVDEDT
jgi:hypothetical protein